MVWEGSAGIMPKNRHPCARRRVSSHINFTYQHSIFLSGLQLWAGEYAAGILSAGIMPQNVHVCARHRVSSHIDFIYQHSIIFLSGLHLWAGEYAAGILVCFFPPEARDYMQDSSDRRGLPWIRHCCRDCIPKVCLPASLNSLQSRCNPRKCSAC